MDFGSLSGSLPADLGSTSALLKSFRAAFNQATTVRQYLNSCVKIN